MTAGRSFILTVHMWHRDLFWFGPNKATIFRSLLGLTASAAMHQPSQEPQLPCGTQLHNILGTVISQSAFWSESCSCYCCFGPLPHRHVKEQNRKRRELASEMPTCWQVLFTAANGNSHGELRERVWVVLISWGGDICYRLLIVTFFTPKPNLSSSPAVMGYLCLCIWSKSNFHVKLGKASYCFHRLL